MKRPDMATLVRIYAPRDPLGWAWRWVMFCTLITLLNFVVEVVRDGQFVRHPVEFAITTSLVATPFVLMGLALTAHLNDLQERLAQLATTDMLTGLHNRRGFLDAAETARAEAEGVVLMLDLDHFKAVNDVHGHAVGDACLQAIARKIEASVRCGDVVGRLGGEEFAIYLVDAPVSAARRIGERLAEGVRVTIDERGVEVIVTVSVGGAPTNLGGSLADLLAKADRALYAAKDAGRARLVLLERAA